MSVLIDLLHKKKKALVVVAHPDDETIWMGGCMLRYKNIIWTCFSLCRASDEDRAPKFRKVCRHYGADCLITDLDDEGVLEQGEASKEAEKLIVGKISGDNYDYIFTHGNNGEYGHKRHISVNNAIERIIEKKIIKPEAVFYFCYKKEASDNNKIIAGDDCNLELELSDEEFAEKKRIVSEMHGYPMDGIDVGYCTNPEAFQVVLLNK